MEADTIISNVCIISPLMEELEAAFSAISDLDNYFLRNSSDSTDYSHFHAQIKKMFLHTSNYYNHDPFVKEIKNEIKNQSTHFVPCGVEAFHISDLSPPPLPAPKPVMPVNDLSPPPNETHDVQMLNYPIISSVQFSLIDEQPQLVSLLERAASYREVGIELICHNQPLLLSAICISTRECEYLIDVAEVPTALADLKPLFENSNTTKIFFNSARTCNLLHMFGIAHIVNVFCISTAACSLNLPSSLEELTLEFRNRLGEGWIRDGLYKITNSQIPNVKSNERLSNISIMIDETAKDDWRIRPFSLMQMRIARQQVHYNLYLYDSLRLKLKEDKPHSLNDVFLISQHKASTNWSQYRHYIINPNSTLLCSIFQQPLPNSVLYKTLMSLKQNNPGIMTDRFILVLSLNIPTSEEKLRNCLEIANPPHQLCFNRKLFNISPQLQSSILSITNKFLQSTHLNVNQEPIKKTKTLEETITELGWIPRNENNGSNNNPPSTPQKAKHQIDFNLDTTVSPRLVKGFTGASASIAGSYLRHLRDPDQPTSVSLQIEGIPRTEAKIYQLANNVRMMQKLQGKTKAKLTSGKDEQIIEETPDEVLHSLVSIGYIDEDEASKIKEKISAPKPQRTTCSKRARSSDSKLVDKNRTGSQPYNKRPRQRM